ncbi:MAG: phosphomethylpyrimidine synthase ThiC [Candidatus Omnitrophica bacterium]|jgi:phosphomethylpyrimidine synthase|nr:phosphomethylpyrimidine synthase ThiC [Candidatus Omnitrophota bacterium]
MTQIERAKKNQITDLVRLAAKREGVSGRFISSGLKNGTIVMPCNKKRRLKSPCAIGAGLRTKINANIGASSYVGSVKEELKKLDICLKYYADTVMDLSTSSDLRSIRNAILARSAIPVGTVPIYETAVNMKAKGLRFSDASLSDILDAIESQAKEGVDFFTIHAGVTRAVINILKKNRRIAGIVSRGGALMADWMSANKKENPLYEHFDRVIAIAKEFDICLSLGDGLRPGSVCDASDKAQIAELKTLGALARQALACGVQVMIEGPGHVPINQIEFNMKMQKRICNNAPFYVLGPLVTDVSPGYDHISSAIGAAMAGYYGADFLCYVTPAEHLSIPTIEDVKEGLIAYKIAAHSADIAKGVKGAMEWDKAISVFRRKRDWKRHIKLSLDPDKADKLHKRFYTRKTDLCTMCGEYCPLKILEDI